MKRPFVYICSPSSACVLSVENPTASPQNFQRYNGYRGDTAANAHKAREYCRKAYEAGYLPLAPHLLFPQFLDEAVPEERENGLEMAKALLRRCASIAICGEVITDGMMDEIMLANRLNKPCVSIEETQVMRKIGKTPRGEKLRH